MLGLRLIISMMLAIVINMGVLKYLSSFKGVRNSLKDHPLQLVLLLVLVFIISSIADFPNEFGISGALLLFSLMILVVMAFIDYQKMILPDTLNLLLLIVVIVGKIMTLEAFSEATFRESLLGLAVGGGLFYLIAVVTRGAMGGGDIKLMAVLGLWLGYPEVLALTMLSFIMGAILSVVLLITKIKGRKDFIPFGPFIILGMITVYFYGDSLFTWYMQLLS